MEKSITKKIIDNLNKLPGCWVWKRLSSGSSNNTGFPDITGVYRSIRLEIEVKQPGKKPNSLQLDRLISFRKLGCIAFWTDEPLEVTRRVKTWYDFLQNIDFDRDFGKNYWIYEDLKTEETGNRDSEPLRDLPEE